MRKPKNIKIGDYTLEEILERHMHWLNRDCENCESMQADLHGAILSRAILIGANMYDADLSGANMYGADLRGAILRGANMYGADLSCANMNGADLSGANMYGADLSCANMNGANLSGAILSCANVNGADLSGADRLRKGIKLSEPIIGWKKCKNNVLVKLEIPRGAIVFSINNKKCRTDKAKVLEIIGGNRAYSNHKFFSYYVGDVIEIFDFNCEYNIECAEGIHFFRTRKEAENY